jgi:DNA-binding transcriptional LysR family regulator
MSSARDVLTPDALFMLNAIAQNGSFAGAAREIGVVPSALSYRVRQMEEALDVLLFSRSSRQAKLTAAGRELLTEGSRLLLDMDSIAHRVKRVATGWESQLTIAVDAIIDFSILMELSAHFFALNPPTRLKLRNETLSGTLAALTSGQADLAVGVSDSFSNSVGLQFAPLGDVEFVFAVAPHHPLAQMAQPLSDSLIQTHRAVAVADTVPQGLGLTFGLLAGQDVFTVPSMQAKLDAQLRGLGAGFLPVPLAKPYIEQGLLCVCEVMRPLRVASLSYAWRENPGPKGQAAGDKALQWWLQQLSHLKTRKALLRQAPQSHQLGVELGL